MAKNIRDRYEVEESVSLLVFNPFVHYKKGLKWYVITMLILGALVLIYFNQIGDAIKIIVSDILFGWVRVVSF